MNKKTYNLIFTAVFSAIIFVTTAFLHIPVGSGYVHVGDAILYVSALILDMPWALLAGALGEGLADVAGGFAAYAPATVAVKIAVAVLFSLVKAKDNRLFNKFSAFMTVPAGAVTVGGYFVADWILFRNFAFVGVVGNLIQAAASAVIFIIIAISLDKVHIKDKISINN
ncbi:MAG: ECF transporter S component [Eubacterium sp.]|nr:ECF transporter S component [Eubacterium sp.]